MSNGWIGVDLDGTLAKYDGWRGPEHVGEPIKLMCDRVRTWLSQGIEVRIVTARVSGPATIGVHPANKPIQEFCMEQFGVILDITNEKDYGMIQLWDDRAIQIIPNTGIRADGGE